MAYNNQIPPQFIEDLLTRTDVVEVVGRYVSLKKAGANFVGLCPFHGEKTPSFSVSPSKQFYHCFGCSKNGNAIGFLMDYVGLGFIDAVKDLAIRAGMQVPTESMSPQAKAMAQAQQSRKTSLQQALEKATTFYQKELEKYPQARDYLAKREVHPSIAKTFGIGYAPHSWRPLSTVFANYDDPLLIQCGLVVESSPKPALNQEKNMKNDEIPTGNRGNDHHLESTKTTSSTSQKHRYDRFRNRIIFPIRNIKGDLIGLGGRVLGNEQPKYLNSPETEIFNKGNELYGLFEGQHSIRQKKYALVCEGYMDVIALAQAGFTNAVATLGTACTPMHIQKLLRFTNHVIFSFDGDKAGRSAALKAMHIACSYANDTRSIQFLFLPPEHDPDSFIKTFGDSAFERAITNSKNLSTLMLEFAQQGCDMQSAEGRSKFTSVLAPLWQQLPNSVFKQQMLNEAARLSLMTAKELYEQWLPPKDPPIPSQAKSTNTSVVHRFHAHNKQNSYQKEEKYNTFNKIINNNSISKTFIDGNNYKYNNNLPKVPAIHPTAASRKIVLRQDQLVRILFMHSQFWFDVLSAEEHTMLCQLPSVHGAILRWLDAQLEGHGAQPFALLYKNAKSEAFFGDLKNYFKNDLPIRDNVDTATQPPKIPTSSPEESNLSFHEKEQEAKQELYDIVLRMRIQVVQTHLDALVATRESEPLRFEREYSVTNAQFIALKRQLDALHKG